MANGEGHRPPLCGLTQSREEHTGSQQSGGSVGTTYQGKVHCQKCAIISHFIIISDFIISLLHCICAIAVVHM